MFTVGGVRHAGLAAAVAAAARNAASAPNPTRQGIETRRLQRPRESLDRAGAKHLSTAPRSRVMRPRGGRGVGSPAGRANDGVFINPVRGRP